jgi:hypothetical protein
MSNMKVEWGDEKPSRGTARKADLPKEKYTKLRQSMSQPPNCGNEKRKIPQDLSGMLSDPYLYPSLCQRLTEWATGDSFRLYNVHLGHLLGLHAAILLQELIQRNSYHAHLGNHVTLKNKVGKWFYHTSAHIEERTCLTRKYQESSINILIKLGIIETCVSGVPAKKYFKIDIEMVHAILLKMSADDFHSKNQNNAPTQHFEPCGNLSLAVDREGNLPDPDFPSTVEQTTYPTDSEYSKKDSISYDRTIWDVQSSEHIREQDKRSKKERETPCVPPLTKGTYTHENPSEIPETKSQDLGYSQDSDKDGLALSRTTPAKTKQSPEKVERFRFEHDGVLGLAATTDDEHRKLLNDHGEAIVSLAYRKVALWKAEQPTPKRTRLNTSGSDYLKVLRWGIEAATKEMAFSKNTSQSKSRHQPASIQSQTTPSTAEAAKIPAIPAKNDKQNSYFIHMHKSLFDFFKFFQGNLHPFFCSDKYDDRFEWKWIHDCAAKKRPWPKSVKEICDLIGRNWDHE